MVYSSSGYAFRRRLELQDTTNSQISRNNLNLPFMNFSINSNGVKNGGERQWWNHTLNHAGVFVPEIQKKLRLNPIEIQYDSTLFVGEEIDSMFAFSEILWDDSNETILRPKLEIDGLEFANIAVLGYNVSYNTTYNESDWLEKNRIRALDINMNLQTFMVQTSLEGFGISQKFIFDLQQKGAHQNNNYIREVLEANINQSTEEVEDPTPYSGDPKDLPNEGW